MKRLVVIPAAAVALFLGGRALAGPAGEMNVYIIEIALLAVGVFVAGVGAALRFERGDYLRLAWYLLALSYLALAPSAPLRWVGPGAALARSIITLIANGLAVFAMWQFARAYKVAGIDLGSRAKQIVTAGVTGIAALAVAGAEMLDAIHGLQHGQIAALIDLVGAVGDVIVLALIAPILLTALALRGGLLMWPWIFIAGANIAWLLDDAQGLIAERVGRPAQAFEGLSEGWRVLACALMLCAGLAQRRLLAPEATRPPS